MEDFTDLVVLAVVQGVTEFLPISSAGHLILTSKFFGMDRTVAEGTTIDVALHIGTLCAVLIYFWRDVRDAVFGPFTLYTDLRRKQPLRWSSKLAVLLVLATLPLVIFGIALVATGMDEALRDESGLFLIKLIGWTTLLYGIALYVADRYAPAEREITDWNWKSALFMGVAQALALIPGTSRSGITMTASRVLGFDRREGARIALLMSIPAIIAPGVFSAVSVASQGDMELTIDALIGAGLSFITAYGALFLLMRWLRRATFTPFVIYRLILGAFLLGAAYGAPYLLQTEAEAPALAPAADGSDVEVLDVERV